MGRGLLALFQNDNRFLIRNTQRALVYDWVDGSFQYNQEVISNEDGLVPDIDMAGRSLIASMQVMPGGVGYYYVQGAAGSSRVWSPTSRSMARTQISRLIGNVMAILLK